MKKAHICIAMIAATLVAALSLRAEQVLLLPWLPQAQFAGAYVAKEAGYFSELGVNVRIIHKLPELPLTDYIDRGRADFIVSPLATIIPLLKPSRELVNIAQINQNSPIVLVARKADKLGDPPFSRKVRAGIWSVDFGLLPRLFLERNRVDYEEVPVNSGTALFLWGVVDLICAMDYNEYYTLLAAGISPDELVVYRMRDHGLNVPEDGLYTLCTTAEKNPEICKKIRTALLRGWQRAVEDPQYALLCTRRYMEAGDIAYDPAMQKWMIESFSKAMLPGSPRFGELRKSDYESTVKLLIDNHIVSAAPPYFDFIFNPAGKGAEQ